MAYNKEDIFKKAKELAIKHNLFWIEDIVAMLPLTKPTFYDLFQVDSNEFNELKAILEDNRINLKVKLRKKWQDSESPALQMGLMKLLSNPEELKRLSVSYTENENNNKNRNIIEFKDFGKDTDSEEI
jgi:hypothetical protein